MKVEELANYGYPRKYIEYLRERGILALNPVQVEALTRGIASGRNLVVVAPTASGKTLVAELALVKDILRGGMGIYLTPLRALAAEKYTEFKRLEKVLDIRVEITTGDFDQPAEYLGTCNIVVATYERFDSLMRLKPTWLSKVSLIVIDELHNINDPDRGPVVEIIIARAKRLGARVVGLSASVGNPEDLASWIGAELVVSNWRPVKLVEGFLSKSEKTVRFIDGREEHVELSEEDPLIDLVLHNLKLNHQTLVFIHNRKRVEELAMELSKLLKYSPSKELSSLIEDLEEAPVKVEREVLAEALTRGVGFHHAGLSYTSRRVVEEAFRRRLIKVVFATPTLAAGINLPARRVLVSVKRYDPSRGRKVNISVSEYKQMAGRAGRPQYDEIGESIIIDAESVLEAYKYIYSQPEPVSGKVLADEKSLRTHVLAFIASGEATSISELASLFRETLSAKGKKIDLEALLSSVVETLETYGMIERSEFGIKATRLGKITSFSYLDPLTVVVFLKLKPSSYSEFYVLHLMTLTPDFIRSSPHVPVRVLRGYEDLAEAFYDSSLTPSPSTQLYDYDDWLKGFVLAMALRDWINEKREDEIYEKYDLSPGDLYNLKDTASWIASSLSKALGVLGEITYYRELQKLSQRLDKGVKEDALELASLKYIGRVRARVLIENGIRTLEDLARTPRRKLLALPHFGPRIVDEIYEQLKSLGYKLVD